MIFIDPKNIDRRFWNFAFIIVITGVFLPVFLSVFSAHTDGLFVMTQKGSWLGDTEASIMFMQGRPLGALTNSFLGWFIYKAEDLTYLRMAAFLLTLISSRLIYLIARRENVETVWSYWLAFTFILLPSNILHVVWVANGIPESLGVLCGVSSYFFFAHSKLKSFILRWFLAAVCFLIGLLMYQPMAMIVFALIAVKLLWSDPDTWPSIRIKVLGEIFVYCFLLAVYWIMIKLIVLPLGAHILKLIPTTWPTYKMALASSITGKGPLIADTFKYGFIGVWDPLLHQRPSLESWLTVILLAGGCGLIFLLKRSFVQVRSAGRFFQKLFVLAVLFFCANAPSFMAVNCKEVMGYRTLLPASFMGLLVIAYFFRYCHSAVKDGWVRIVTNCFIVIYSFAALMMASWTVDQNVYNNLKTYLYVDTLASRIDYSKIEKIYLRYSSPVWSAYSLPFEMGYLPVDLNYIFDKYSSLKGRPVKVYETFIDWPLFFDPYTAVVDLEFLSNKRLSEEKKVYIYPTSGAREKVLVTENFDQMKKYPVLKFIQVTADGRLPSEWEIPSAVYKAFVYLHFIGRQESLLAYAIDTDCLNAHGGSSFFDFKWQGLNKRKQWVDVSGLTSALGETRISQIVNSSAFNDLRLVFIKRMPADILIVKELQFISH